jgi:hypothetical protein
MVFAPDREIRGRRGRARDALGPGPRLSRGGEDAAVGRVDTPQAPRNEASVHGRLIA